MESKDLIQKEAIKKWIASEYRGTLVVGTGVGKTKMGLMGIDSLLLENLNNLPNFSVLIIVPTTNLRDNEWENEIEKWFPHLRKYITIQCIQTVYGWNQVFLQDQYSYDLIIVDEIHTTLSPIYRRIFSCNLGKYWLGLTATPPHIEEYSDFLSQVCPIIFRTSMEEAVSLGLISDYEIVNIPIGLTRQERGKYNAYTKMYTNSVISLSRHGSAFDIASKARLNKDNPLYKTAQTFWRGMSLRKWVCYRAEHKITAALKIIQHVPRKKWVVFCHDTKLVDSLKDKLLDAGIFSVAYHSNMPNKNRENVLNTAKQALCSVICTAQALNTGYNLPDIDAILCLSSTGVELTFIQQLGRGVRIDSNSETHKKTLYVNLYAKDTQEDTWLKNKLTNFDKVTECDLDTFINANEFSFVSKKSNVSIREDITKS